MLDGVCDFAGMGPWYFRHGISLSDDEEVFDLPDVILRFTLSRISDRVEGAAWKMRMVVCRGNAKACAARSWGTIVVARAERVNGLALLGIRRILACAFTLMDGHHTNDRKLSPT